MGEYADMMLEGICCAGCGEYLDGGGIIGVEGIPDYCSEECAPADLLAAMNEEPRSQGKAQKAPCPECGKMVGGMAQHMAAKHPGKEA